MLFYDLQEVWDAFWILNKTRSSGLSGIESLKLIEVKALIELFGIDNVHDFIDYTYVLDEEYMKLIEKKIEQDDKKKKKKGNNLSNKGTGK